MDPDPNRLAAGAEEALRAQCEPSEVAAVMATIPDSPRLRRILRDLESIMLHEGFLHLSMGEVATRLRCSKTTLYRLAPSLDDLFTLVINLRMARNVDDAWRAYWAARDWPSRLVGFLGAILTSTHDVSYEYVRDRSVLPAAVAARKHSLSGLESTVAAIIQGGVEAGAFRPVNTGVVARFAVAGMEQVCHPEFLAAQKVSLEEVHVEVWRLLGQALLVETAPERDARPSRRTRP